MMDNSIRSISVVIPVYKTSTILVELVNRLIPVLIATKCMFEIIFVDDGSTDESWFVLNHLYKKFDFVRAFRLSKNYGQHNAILCGIFEAKGDVVITMDDDLQHPPEVLPELLNALTTDIDVVYGSPKFCKHSFFRVVSSKITKIILQNVMGAKNAVHVSALRVFRRNFTSAWYDIKTQNINIDVMLTWVTNKFTYVLVDHHERNINTSGYTLIKLINHGFNLITGFSRLPLLFTSILGILFSGFGFCIFVYVVIRWFLQENVVPGFAFLASIIAIFSGIQLLAIGIIGEYISRIFDRTSGKPRFVLRESLN